MVSAPVHAPLAVQEVALLEDQVKTDAVPTVTEVGLAASVTVGCRAGSRCVDDQGRRIGDHGRCRIVSVVARCFVRLSRMYGEYGGRTRGTRERISKRTRGGRSDGLGSRCILWPTPCAPCHAIKHLLRKPVQGGLLPQP